MAKATDIPGLEPGMSYAQAAALTVAIRGEEVFEHNDGVLDMVDIERVHDMRVATRRLRAVLEIYAPCFPHDELRPVLREVKKLADALGARRDPDVELLALEQFAASVGPDELPGVEYFITRTRAEQEEGNRLLAEVLEQVERSALRRRIASLARLAARPPENGAHDGGGQAATHEHHRGDKDRHHHRHADGHHDRDADEHDNADAQEHHDAEAPRELLADRVYGLGEEPE